MNKDRDLVGGGQWDEKYIMEKENGISIIHREKITQNHNSVQNREHQAGLQKQKRTEVHFSIGIFPPLFPPLCFKSIWIRFHCLLYSFFSLLLNFGVFFSSFSVHFSAFVNAPPPPSLMLFYANHKIFFHLPSLRLPLYFILKYLYIYFIKWDNAFSY